MQVYKVPKITGFSAEQLAQRLEEAMINEQAATEVKEKYSPTYGKVKMPLASEQQVTERVLAASETPLSKATADQKYEILKAEYQRLLARDKDARKRMDQIIAKKTESHLKSMNLNPDEYNYSSEYERTTE